MAGQYATMVIALSSAVVGGTVALLGVFLTNRSNTTRLKMQLEHESLQRGAELLRSRGEELYELADKWLNMLAGNYLRVSAVMQGRLTYNQCYELAIQEGKENSFNFGRIEMLIDVYFASTRSAYDKIIDGRTELNKIETEYKRSYKGGDIDGSIFLASYVKCQHSIEKTGETFKMQVRECIRAL